MREHLSFIFIRYNYPTFAMAKLLEAYDILEKNPEFLPFVDKFHTKGEVPARNDVETVLDKISADSGVHPYTAKFVYYLCVTKRLPERYKEAGIPEEYMWEMIEDFRYKLDECLDVHGIPGFFANPWFYKFMTLEQFKLGKLEFEIAKFPHDGVEIAGRKIEKDSEVINVHIPSGGGKFDRASRLDCYKRAYAFFRDYFGKEIDVFRCGSWLLYPPNKEMLSATSNIVSFMDDFKIYQSADYSDPRQELWRLFGGAAKLPFNELPRKTSLERAYADRLMAGLPLGGGSGAFIWDDKNNTTITE